MYKSKYIKYKMKYLKLKQQQRLLKGGNFDSELEHIKKLLDGIFNEKWVMIGSGAVHLLNKEISSVTKDTHLSKFLREPNDYDIMVMQTKPYKVNLGAEFKPVQQTIEKSMTYKSDKCTIDIIFIDGVVQFYELKSGIRIAKPQNMRREYLDTVDSPERLDSNDANKIYVLGELIKVIDSDSRFEYLNQREIDRERMFEREFSRRMNRNLSLPFDRTGYHHDEDERPARRGLYFDSPGEKTRVIYERETPLPASSLNFDAIPSSSFTSPSIPTTRIDFDTTLQPTRLTYELSPIRESPPRAGDGSIPYRLVKDNKDSDDEKDKKNK